MCNTCRYEASEPLDQQVWKAWISEAIVSIIDSQPFLRVGIAGEDTNSPNFVHVTSIDLDNHVSWRTDTPKEGQDTTLLSAVEERHNSLWPDISNRPPWSVTILGGEGNPQYVDVIFSWHHAIGDGLSGQMVQKALLQALRETKIPAATQPARSSIIRYPERPVLPPPQEEAVNLSIGWWYMLKTLWAEFRPAFLAPTPVTPWGGELINLERPYKTNVRLVTIDNETRNGLITLCRMHGTTLTGLIQVLILASFARQLPSEKSFTAQTPMSLRPYASTEGFDLSKTMLVLVTGLHHRFTPVIVSELQSLLSSSPSEGDTSLEDKIWELAASVKGELKRKADELPANDIMGLLQWVSNWHERLKKADGTPRDTTWEVSNVGIIGNEGAAGKDVVRISRQVFSQSAIMTGPAMCASVAGCQSSGSVSISLSWQEGVLDHNLVEGIKKDLEAWMRNLGTSGKLR